ncbi:hypothetical protein [Cellulomonas aerilata]|nr:hypothetical protein [Cellulomonas aerilata]
MAVFEDVWLRIEAHAGEQFRTITGLPFTYAVPGAYLRVEREGHVIDRSLSKTNFERATAKMPASGPGEIKDRQGSAYTWAILMDPRVRASDW